MNRPHSVYNIISILMLLACGIIGSLAVAASNPICPENTTLCNGTCINTSIDLLDCSSCLDACPDQAACINGRCSCLAGLALCNGTCNDTRFDTLNCGSCGNACPPGMSCFNGICLCPVGLTFCNGTCVDVFNDRFNCGTCSNSCPPDQICFGGLCTDRPANVCINGYCSYPLEMITITLHLPRSPSGDNSGAGVQDRTQPVSGISGASFWPAGAFRAPK